MNTIKFRAWDTINKTFDRDVMIDIYGGQYEILQQFRNPKFEPTTIEQFKERYVIQKCTGLKDSKGTEIYEGDILKRLCGGDNLYEIRYGLGSYDCGCYKYIGFKLVRLGETEEGEDVEETTNMFWIEKIDEFEVIGNIYQNKELFIK